MLSLSTSWNALRHNEGYAMISEIKALGFEGVEINYQVTAEQLPGIQKLYQEGQVTISSLHNIVPMPAGADPNTAHRLFPFTSPNPEVRRTAVELTKKTIDHAAGLGAKGIVLHLGESWDSGLIDLERSFVSARIKSFHGQEKINELKSKLVSLRKIYSEPGIERIRECLKELLPYAEERRVKLGLENRYWYAQFPNPEELAFLLQEFRSDQVGLWYDMGHSATLEYLGFLRKNELMEKFSDRMIGVHLMDCIRNSDHLPPGKGNIDFSNLAKVLKQDTIKVIELAPGVSASESREGVTFLQKQGIG